MASGPRPGGPPTVVLVHGAWHGAWCWDHAIAAIAADGIQTLAIDLPGHGDDPGPLAENALKAAQRVRDRKAELEKIQQQLKKS